MLMDVHSVPRIMHDVLAKIWLLITSEVYRRGTLISLNTEIFLLFKIYAPYVCAVENLSFYLLADLIYY